MDIDLFQGVLLALLVVGLVVLIALLATLGGIRRALERRPSVEAAAPPAATGSTADAPLAESPAATYAAPQPVAEQPAAQTSPAASGAPGQADTIRSVLQQHGLSESAQPAGEPVVDSVFASHADDPQEEPFQRDGRWWFRRGNELLLYNEGTGQWEPAPASSSGAAASSSGAATPAPAAAPAQQVEPTPAPAAVTTDMPAVADQVATFWKCPTCGAVNGSTAGSCRMCFAARP